MKTVKQIRKISQNREKSMGKEIGGRSHVASGALWFKKNDYSSEKVSCEDKVIFGESYSLSYDTLFKLEKQANKVKKTPVFSFGYDKYQENFVLVQSNCYNKYEPDTYLQKIVKNKSIKLNYLDIKALVVPHVVMAEYIFEEYNKKYILMTWQDFVDNITDFYI